MKIKYIAGWLILIVLAWYLFTKPTGAGAAVHNLFNLLKAAGVAIAKFVQSA